MKLISWNVNGIRAAYNKGLLAYLHAEAPDIVCIQETKAHSDQLSAEQIAPLSGPGYFSSAIKKGYSGVATLTTPASKPRDALTGIGIDIFDTEGRFLITEHDSFTLYNIYFPSGTTGNIRQEFKYTFLEAVYDHLAALPAEKRDRSIVCGDFNICHRPIDIHHPDKAKKLELSGFLPEERAWLDRFVALGFVDTFRHVHGDISDRYSWWTYRAGARQKNLGWRIDYFFVPEAMKNRIQNADIQSSIPGSDHAPLVLELDL